MTAMTRYLKPGDRVEIEGFSAVGQPAVTGDAAVTLSEGTRTLTLTVDGELTAAVIEQLRVLLKSPEVVMATSRAATAENAGLSEAVVREALERLDPLWEELFPAEQARIVQLLVQRVDLKADGLELRLRTQGLGRVVRELGAIGDSFQRAA
jgi:hypothetical protein